MQNALPIPHSVSEVFWLALAIILASVSGGGGFAVLNLYLNRRKPAAEVHESEARTAKTLAETRSLDLQTNISAGDAVLRMVQQMAFDQVAIEQKNEIIERLENANEIHETQLRKAKALLHLHNIQYDEDS